MKNIITAQELKVLKNQLLTVDSICSISTKKIDEPGLYLQLIFLLDKSFQKLTTI